MENKKTTELLDLMWKLENLSGDKCDWDKHEEVAAELRKRYPFSEILGEKDDVNDFTLEENIDNLLDDVKLLKRHKHHEKTGDVMVRI